MDLHRKAASLKGFKVEERTFTIDEHGLIFRKEDLDFDQYLQRLTYLIDSDINCPARCWLRAMNAKKAEELGI